MLVPVEYQTVSKWVKVPTTDDVYSYSGFIQEVRQKFNLPESTTLILKDSTEVEVDPDIFDELLKSVQVSLKAFTKDSNDDKTEDLSPDPPVSEASFSDSSFSEWSPSRASIASSGSSSDSTIILKSTRARKRQTLEGPPDSTVARDIVQAALQSKPGGEKIFKEYDQKKCLSDGTRRKMVNILAADMVETHGRIPPNESPHIVCSWYNNVVSKLKGPRFKEWI
ncbi:uncharacterized protein LOC114462305 [Gouania willdenowi]|uniref:uncharacterized protein LOC114462305 n=1 Tax=Gouania willdenowi TaxID=441366 RepID=UPI0010556DC7|nr:uncharacterized protein LOC114462305 [Gouania willdenowi]